MDIATIFGGAAAILTTASFVPQAIKVVKTRETNGISLWMYMIFTLGVFFWLLYGIMVMAVPIICANAVTLCFSSIILYYKLTEKK